VLRPHRIGVGLYDRSGDGLVLRRRLDVAVEGERTDLGLAAADAPDLLLLNDGDLTFAKVRLDDRSLATARTRPAPAGRPAGPRAGVGVAVGRLPRRRAAGGGLRRGGAGQRGRRADPAVVAALLGQARTAAVLYTADGARSSTRWPRRPAGGRRRAARQRPAAGPGARLRRHRPQRAARRRAGAAAAGTRPRG
jgi:aminopeptidase N